MNLDRSFVTFVSIDFDILDDSTGALFILLTCIGEINNRKSFVY
jgi:hypothetical protein